MKKYFVLVLLVFASLSFAQQSPYSGLNYKKSTDDILQSNSLKLPLNMDFFKLKDAKPNNHALSQLLKQSSIRKTKPKHNMPIFVPEGAYFLQIYDVDKEVDYKLRIFELRKSNYSERSAG